MGRDREFSDPVVTSVRAERADLELAKALDLKLSAALRNGIRNLSEGYIEGLKECPREWNELLVHLKKRDAEESELRFKSEERSRLIVAEQIAIRKKAITEVQEESTPSSLPGKINWASVPEYQKVTVYIQSIVPIDERKLWIQNHIEADDENKFLISSEFAKRVISIFRDDPNKPFTKIDIGEIRRILSTWADAEGSS